MNQIAVLAIYALGINATLEDWRSNKITNRWILWGLALSVLGYFYLALNTILGSQKISFLTLGSYYLPPAFYPKALCHFGLGLAAGLALWYLRLWPAGDAKLFIVLSSLLTLADFNLRGFPSFLCLTALINIFVSAGLYVLVLVSWELLAGLARLASEGMGKERHALLDRLRKRLADEWPKRYSYLSLAWNTFVLFFLMQFLRVFLRLPSLGLWEPLALYVACYLLWDRLSRLFVRRDVTGYSFSVVALLLIPAGAYLKWELLVHLIRSGQLVLGFGIFLMVTQMFVFYYLRQTRTASLPAAELRAGMILSREAWLAIRDEGSPESVAYADGLSIEEVELVKRRCAQKSLSEVQVHLHRPFAFWVFFGCLWSLHCSQNLIQWLISRLPRL